MKLSVAHFKSADTQDYKNKNTRQDKKRTQDYNNEYYNGKNTRQENKIRKQQDFCHNKLKTQNNVIASFT